MFTLQSPFPQDLPSFFLLLSLVGFFLVLGELLTRKFGVNALVVRKVLHLGMGVVIFFIPTYFQSNFYPAVAAVLFTALGGLSLRAGLLRSLHGESENTCTDEDGPVISYGPVLFPLAFLILVLVLWDGHLWALRTSMLVMGIGDALAALVGTAFGGRHIEHMTRSSKTVEGSLAMFISSFVILSVSLFLFRESFTGGLAGKPVWELIALALLLSLVATGVEALLSYGLDNLFIPLSIAYVLYVVDINRMVTLEGFLIGGLFALLLALFSIKVKFLTNSGATATFLLGTNIFGVGGMVWTVPLLTFYLLSSVLSKLGRKRKAKFDLVFEKGSQRDADQVYANGGVAWIMMVIFSLTNDPYIFFSYLGTLAAVQADTWATEIGTMWPNPKARLITTLREVPVGTSGGVSIPGTSASFIGSLLICGSAALMNVGWINEVGILKSLLVIGIAGLFASLVDSFFGATFQAQYYDPIRDKVTERTHSTAADGSKVKNELIKGYHFVNNDLVNTLCAISGSAVAYFVVQNLAAF
ncbi:MAG: DUF92 domain-containing protein [Chlorobiaceae bacterium]|nr:DUF92 domain-containing protein [Chlorobiaceae bacterium]NTV26179.1 DUF92 domain-containing protein [Chlorobiaceae bacterium]